jgi:hypothetical protein
VAALLQSERPVLHAYKQVVPSQLGVPVVVSHFLPHAEQLVTVLSSVQVLPHVVSLQAQVAVALTQSGVGWAQAVPSTQVPAGHVSGVLPLHASEPGVHCTQELLKHTGVVPVHVISVCHTPLLSHC